MKGLELSRAYYEQYGKAMLHDLFPEYEHLIAVGLVGAGSECFGYDDEHSRDHDFEPGFCLFLPGEELVDSRAAFRIERAYARLPKVFKGISRLTSAPAGGYRHGVIRTRDFYAEKTGAPTGPQSLDEWLSLPDSYLAEATDGEVFRDDYGEFSRIRAHLLEMPRDVRRKRLAGHLWLCCQSAPYNYGRCLRHGETTAAGWALYEFADRYLSALFCAHGVYRPFFKWAFRALRSLPNGEKTEKQLKTLLFAPNDASSAEEKKATVGDLSRALLTLLTEKGLLSGEKQDLAAAAFEINDRIKDNDLRNRNILCGV